MTSVHEIKAAVDRLSLSERAELEKLLHGWEDDAWDERIKRDFDGGKLDAILKEVEGDIKGGWLGEGP